MSSPPANPAPLIEFRLWRQFVAVAEELHFGRAALRLHMTQPPLTQAIAQMEAVLGYRLFDRTKRSVQLTAAGAALLPEARDLLARAQALPAYGRASADGEAGRLRLAFVSTVGFDLLPRWVRAFREQHPRVDLELIEATGDVQLQAFDRGEIDAAVDHLDIAADLAARLMPVSCCIHRALRLRAWRPEASPMKSWCWPCRRKVSWPARKS